MFIQVGYTVFWQTVFRPQPNLYGYLVNGPRYGSGSN
jgi:hypothetical protein